MSESLNRSLNRFIQNTDLFMKKAGTEAFLSMDLLRDKTNGCLYK